jgi:hypothetical protein
VGLEVMLRGTPGVTRANASYPERKSRSVWIRV